MLLLSAPPEKPFRIRRCNALDCHRLFIVCSRCDCRRRYCCKSCSLNARAEQKRAARRRYRQSFQGRKNQSHRQRAYRRRKADRDRASAATAAADIVTADLDPASATAEKIVMDPSSITTPTSATITRRPVPASFQTPRQRWLSEFGEIVCCFCGRAGRFLNPFYSSG